MKLSRPKICHDTIVGRGVLTPPPLFYEDPPYCLPPFSNFVQLLPPLPVAANPTLTALSVVLFPWLDVWSCHIWCTTLLTRAYSRLILYSTIEHCPLLQKLCNALFWCKTLRKGIEKGGGGEIFGALFFLKKVLFYKKVPFLANIKCCPKFLEYACLLILWIYTCQALLPLY